MKQIYILILACFFLSLKSYSQNCNIGNESITEDFIDGDFLANYLLGVKFTLPQEGTLRSINLIGNGTGTGIQMAVYDDNGGVPNNLIAHSELSTVGSGVTTLPVTPILLPAGDYWIMAVYEADGNHSNTNKTAYGNVVYYQGLNYGDNIPNNASGFTNYTDQDFLYFLAIDCGDTLSIDDSNFDNEISLIPNPSSDFISISNLKSAESYSIINQIGQEVKRGVISNQEKIYIGDFTNGLYLFKFKNGNAIKFIKE
ncbi:MAG: T9SS type A sorting domain-containing protein [Bacteroidales bacterium]|nr:T9SS type A sorting domain-containing protein [Bacteroidales bacterium]